MLTWTWARGQATTAQDFADPTADGDYAVCIYGGAPGSEKVVYDAGVPASAAWTARPRDQGYRYMDRTGGERGVRRVLLKTGAEGKSEIGVRAAGAAYFRSVFSVPTPVTAQLVNLDSGTCWQSAFTAGHVQRSDVQLFKARFPD